MATISYSSKNNNTTYRKRLNSGKLYPMSLHVFLHVPLDFRLVQASNDGAGKLGKFSAFVLLMGLESAHMSVKSATAVASVQNH